MLNISNYSRLCVIFRISEVRQITDYESANTYNTIGVHSSPFGRYFTNSLSGPALFKETINYEVLRRYISNVDTFEINDAYYEKDFKVLALSRLISINNPDTKQVVDQLLTPGYATFHFTKGYYENRI